ncbi:lariat debranching enzyme a [Cystoisospora suis]|uniref:Lariat debranching enzyme a n=1 Tax=Cystoisospora suis TaxID=483139 RepID=A0A2C6KI73_9APIC|nr:lariat debranching enzyme a [Cystoisospora suis]
MRYSGVFFPRSWAMCASSYDREWLGILRATQRLIPTGRLPSSCSVRKPTADDYQALLRNLNSMNVELRWRGKRRDPGEASGSRRDHVHAATLQKTATQCMQSGRFRRGCDGCPSNGVSDDSFASICPGPLVRGERIPPSFTLGASRCTGGENSSGPSATGSERLRVETSQARCDVSELGTEEAAIEDITPREGANASGQGELHEAERTTHGEDTSKGWEQAQDHGRERSLSEEDEPGPGRDYYVWPHWNTVDAPYRDLKAQRLFLLKVLGFQEKDDVFGDPPATLAKRIRTSPDRASSTTPLTNTVSGSREELDIFLDLLHE